MTLINLSSESRYNLRHSFFNFSLTTNIIPTIPRFLGQLVRQRGPVDETRRIDCGAVRMERSRRNVFPSPSDLAKFQKCSTWRAPRKHGRETTRDSFDEELKLKSMQGVIDERRHARAARKASRDEEGRRRPSLISDGDGPPAPKTGKCKKHSKCHCFLFSLDSVEFYAVGNGGEERGSDWPCPCRVHFLSRIRRSHSRSCSKSLGIIGRGDCNFSMLNTCSRITRILPVPWRRWWWW